MTDTPTILNYEDLLRFVKLTLFIVGVIINALIDNDATKPKPQTSIQGVK